VYLFVTAQQLFVSVEMLKMCFIILPLVWCGYETWSFTLREEYWLRVFENGVLRKILGPERDEV
jgi:hypothetical protein